MRAAAMTAAKAAKPAAKEPGVTPAQAAKRLGASGRAVRGWCETGLLSAWKTPGGHYKIDPDAVSDLIAMRTKASARVSITEALQAADRELTALGASKQLLRSYRAAMSALGVSQC